MPLNCTYCGKKIFGNCMVRADIFRPDEICYLHDACDLKMKQTPSLKSFKSFEDAIFFTATRFYFALFVLLIILFYVVIFQRFSLFLLLGAVVYVYFIAKYPMQTLTKIRDSRWKL